MEIKIIELICSHLLIDMFSIVIAPLFICLGKIGDSSLLNPNHNLLSNVFHENIIYYNVLNNDCLKFCHDEDSDDNINFILFVFLIFIKLLLDNSLLGFCNF